MTEDESSQRLRQLLRLKRHESPPPGYFHEFSGGVLDRIRAIEAERSTPFWRRGWFRSASSVPGGSEVRAAFWPLWAGSAVGALALVALIGGFYWAGVSSSPDGSVGGLATGGSTGASAASADPAHPRELRGSSAALAGMAASDWNAGVGESRVTDPQWNAGFRWPVTVSMAPNPMAHNSMAHNSMAHNSAPGVAAMPVTMPVTDLPRMSSTNPLPAGLFRLPGAAGGAGPEAYRVRFGDAPR